MTALIKRFALLFVFATFPVVGLAAINEGQDYQKLPTQIVDDNAARSNDAVDEIEVIEFFSFNCPHCASVAPDLNAWLVDKPDNVRFKRVPVVFFENWEPAAKAYYVAEFLGIEEEMDIPIFNAIHQQGVRLQSEDDVRDLFTANGVDGADFDRVYESFAMDNAMRQSNELRSEYGVYGVPSVFVDGQYRTDLTMARSPVRLIEIIEDLVTLTEQERAATPKAEEAS